MYVAHSTVREDKTQKVAAISNTAKWRAHLTGCRIHADHHK